MLEEIISGVTKALDSGIRIIDIIIIAFICYVMPPICSGVVSLLGKLINKLIKIMDRNREDSISSDQEFKSMISAVSDYIQDQSSDNQRIAMRELSAISFTETGELSKIIDKLFNAIYADEVSDVLKLREAAIELKRYTRSKEKMPKKNKIALNEKDDALLQKETLSPKP